MQGLMMDSPLLTSSLIVHAARHHGDTEIVSRSVEAALPAGRLFVCVSPPGCQNRSESHPVDSQPPRKIDTITQHKMSPSDNRYLKIAGTRAFSTGC